jgi:hypothetical protein
MIWIGHSDLPERSLGGPRSTNRSANACNTSSELSRRATTMVVPLGVV